MTNREKVALDFLTKAIMHRASTDTQAYLELGPQLAELRNIEKFLESRPTVRDLASKQ